MGIYIFGSAVVGGLKNKSDVDVLVAVNESLTFEQRQVLLTRLMEVSGTIGNIHTVRPIELTVIRVADVVPWRYPPRSEFVYGEWLRKEFDAGAVPNPVCDPDLALVLKTLIDNSLALYGDNAEKVFDAVPMADIQRAIRESLPGLLAEIQGDERNIVLTLSRMWLTSATGEIAPKDTAAEWVETLLPDHQAALVRYARQGYLGKIADDWSGRQEELMALISHMQETIMSCLEG